MADRNTNPMLLAGGKQPWNSKEEEDYALALLECFQQGTLEGLAEGTRLQDFLASKLSSSVSQKLGVQQGLYYVQKEGLSSQEAFLNGRKLKKLQQSYELQMAALELQRVEPLTTQAHKKQSSKASGDGSVLQLFQQQLLLEKQVRAALSKNCQYSGTGTIGPRIPSCGSLADMPTSADTAQVPASVPTSEFLKRTALGLFPGIRANPQGNTARLLLALAASRKADQEKIAQALASSSTAMTSSKPVGAMVGAPRRIVANPTATLYESLLLQRNSNKKRYLSALSLQGNGAKKRKFF